MAADDDAVADNHVNATSTQSSPVRQRAAKKKMELHHNVTAATALIDPVAAPLSVEDEAPLLPAYLTTPVLDPSADQPPHTGPPATHYEPQIPFVSLFSASADHKLRPFDDNIIALVQWPLNTYLRLPALAFAMGFTALSAIEVGIVLPLALYLAGFDDIADQALMCVIVLAVMSQVPKRFMWRARPWMVRRALTVRRDKTSSFPSRAVTCAVVYTFIAGFALLNGYNIGIVIAITLVSALCTSIARIMLGAHFPSDCVVGLIQGAAATAIGYGFYYALLATVSKCTTDGQSVKIMNVSCYTPTDGGSVTPLTQSSQVPWILVTVIFIISLLIQVAVSIAPLKFWTKSSYVFGVLTAAIAFRLSILGRPTYVHHTLIPPAYPPSIFSILLAICLAFGLTFISKYINKLKGIISFIISILISTVIYAIMVTWRLHNV